MSRYRLLMVALAAALITGGIAVAHPPPNADPSLHEWFESLRQPRTGVGCCAESDCRILANDQWRTTQNGYQIRVRRFWINVPPDKILQHQPNPTGSAVACYREGYGPPTPAHIFIYCFVRSTET